VCVCVCVIVGDLESSTMRPRRPNLGYCAKKKLVRSANYEAAHCTVSASLLLVLSS
jgi:hypothetical protein